MLRIYTKIKRWWLTTIYLKRWSPKKEQVLPKEITEGLSLKKVPVNERVVNIDLSKRKR